MYNLYWSDSVRLILSICTSSWCNMIVRTWMIIKQATTNSIYRIHFLLKAAVGLLAKIALLSFLVSFWKLEAFSNAGLPIWWVKKVLGFCCTLGFDYKALHCFGHLISLVPVNICLVSQTFQLLRIMNPKVGVSLYFGNKLWQSNNVSF